MARESIEFLDSCLMTAPPRKEEQTAIGHAVMTTEDGSEIVVDDHETDWDWCEYARAFVARCICDWSFTADTPANANGAAKWHLAYVNWHGMGVDLSH